jgi:hypothetical protein
MPGKTEVDMLRRFKSKAPEKDKNTAANATEVIGGMVQQQHSVVEPVVARPPIPKAGTDSCIGSGMSAQDTETARRLWEISELQCAVSGRSVEARS